MSSSSNKIPVVVVISGPSGVGKDATIARMRQEGDKFHYVVTATTRDKRPGEVDGVDYFFLTENDFRKKIKNDEFIEYAKVYNNMYGVLKSEVRQALAKGEDVIIKVDVQGAATLKRKIPNAVFIFLMPPSIDELEERLKKRNADSENDVSVRIGKAEEELNVREMFNHTVVNTKDDLDKTVQSVKELINKSRGKMGPVII
ncbi:MAG: guanylate kinase [Dehalococcoidia bacterium]|nr:MAG: guanylate kinase [Dehalococcoidia bacterium]